MYFFIQELLYKKCPPLIVKEIDLKLKEGVYRKINFDEEDVRPNFAKEQLEQGFVEFPVYRGDKRMLPLGFDGKSCDYKITKFGLGNVMCITQTYGDIQINPNYMSSTKEKETTTREFRFYFSREEGRYKQEKNNERWAKLVEEAETIKTDKNVLDLLWDFYDFYEEFWIQNVVFRRKRNLYDEPTEEEYIDYLLYLSDHTEGLYDSFIMILYLFDDISEKHCDFLLELLKELKVYINKPLFHIKGIRIREKGVGNPIEDRAELKEYMMELESVIKKAFKPGIYIDPETKETYENLGQLYQRYQPKSKYANAEMLREQGEKLLNSSMKVSAILKDMERESDKYLFAYLPV